MTINNVVKVLEPWSEKWIQVSNLLDIPNSVVNSINVLISHQPNMNDLSALYKVVEWWFVNTASPEWTTIDNIIAEQLIFKVGIKNKGIKYKTCWSSMKLVC